MVLPKLKKFCWCLPLETGSVILCIVSLMACLSAIAICLWKLPDHRHQQNEDNIVLMSMVMFATLSAISNVTLMAGIALHYLLALSEIANAIEKNDEVSGEHDTKDEKRTGCLQLSLLSNAVFILCILLVSTVTCLFSPALRPYLQNPGNIALVVILLISGSAYAIYYLSVVNSLYTKMKMYSGSAIPV